MSKKWLTAVMLTKEKIVKIWDCKVSYDVTDVTVPANTIFYFFSKEKADLEIPQLNLLDTASIVWLDKKLSETVLDNKLYCCGVKKGKSLIVKTNYGEATCGEFFENLNEYFDFEFV